jgi:Type VI secretion, TssG
LPAPGYLYRPTSGRDSPPASGPAIGTVSVPTQRSVCAHGICNLVSLVRAFLGFEIAFAINPVLSGPEVPPLRLDRQADTPSRLGWNSWIPAPEGLPLGIRRADAADAVFEAEIIEAQEFGEREHP